MDTQQLSALQQSLQRLVQQGFSVWMTGVLALRLALDAPPPAGGPLTVVIAGQARDRAAVDAAAQWPADLRDRLQLVFVAPGRDRDAALASWLASQPIRSHAVALTPDGTVVLPPDANGLLDQAREGRLRLRGDLRASYGHDPAACLHIAIAAGRSGLVPGPELIRAIQREPASVLSVPAAERGVLFGEVLLGEHAAVGLTYLLQAGVLGVLLPEVTALVDFHKSCPVHHKDIWDHTLQVVEKCPFTLSVRWAALMHDAGKVATRTVQKGKVHFFRHEELGALLMHGVAARFALPPELGERVCYIIANHARANVYASDWTDSAVRRLIRDMGPHLDDVLAFSRSDWTTKRAGRIAEVKSLAQELAERIPTIAAEDAKVPPLPKGLGTAIMQETGLGAGPWLGQVQQWLQAECDAGRLDPLQEPTYYLAAVRQRAPELLAIDPEAVRQRTPKPGRVQTAQN